MVTNVWGEEVPELEGDEWEVPVEERLDEDDPNDRAANALDDETGDDLDGWKPGDPV